MSPGPSPRRPLRFQRPSMPEAEEVERYFAAAREARFFSNGGPCSQLLRRRLTERVGVGCTPVANATLGLMAALAAVKRPGTEVVMPSFTFPAPLQAARWLGLKPRFVDVEPAGWQMDPGDLARALEASGDAAAVVLACSAFGTPPPPGIREAWAETCAHHRVPWVVDSAAGFGAEGTDGVPVGAQGFAEVVSFHATKPFAIGEGGAVFSRHERVLASVERFVNFGLDAQRAVAESMALNGKLSELHAATALAVLDVFDDVLRARRAAAEGYRDALEGIGRFQADSERSTWQFVPLLLDDPWHRDRCLQRGSEVEFRTYYDPLHAMSAFRTEPAPALPVTEDVAARMLSLPMANDLDAAEIRLVAATISRTLALAA